MNVGDRVQMRRAPRLRSDEPDPVDLEAMLGTVLRVIDPGAHTSAGARVARVRWDSGSESRHSLGMLRVVVGI